MTYTIVTSSPDGPGAGIYVDNGNYANPVTIGPTGVIDSTYYFGASAEHVSWSIVNQGTLEGSRGGVLLGAGGGISNAATGTISGSVGVYLIAGGTVQNAGSIGGSSVGVFVDGAGYVFNGSTGTITGGSQGVYLANGGTVQNAGKITGGSLSVYFSHGGTLIVDPGAVFNGNVYNNMYAASATIELKTGAIAGTLNGLGDKYKGFGTITIDSGASWTVAGTMAGFNGEAIDGLTGSDSLDITDLGFVSGSSSAVLTDGTLAVTNGTTTVDITIGTDGQNFFTHDDGHGGLLVDDLKQDINGSYGSGITLSAASYFPSVTVGAAGIVNGADDGIYAGSAFTIVNKGSINGTSGDGVHLNAGGTATNLGSIYGGTDGVELDQTGLVSNAATGTIAGGTDGVDILNAGGTVENAGTITGYDGDAVHFLHAGDRLIIDPGAVFNGNVVATGAGNTIELKSGGIVGVLNGLNSTKYSHFQTVTIDSLAAWDIGGTKAQIGSSTITIDGFNSHDRIDLTDLVFNAGDTVTVNGTNLIVHDAGGNVTIHMDSSISGKTFQLLNDGNGDTFAEESDYAPCYLKGTRIRTVAGDRPVESLRIGDLVMTASGEALPLKWIGRRAYQGWMAVGNRDVQPILFKAGSIAEGIPARDLYVSPEHAMFLDGMLVPAHLLTNGASILQMNDVRDVEYFHLEFDTHAIILAENAEAESFVDDDSRALFHNAAEYRRLYPNERSRNTEFCAPRVENGPELEDLRWVLEKRAGGGFAISDGAIFALPPASLCAPLELAR